MSYNIYIKNIRKQFSVINKALYCDVDEAYVPIKCDEYLKEALTKRNQFNAHDMYPQMPIVTGVLAKNATYEDFQRVFYCLHLEENECFNKGLQLPRSCSHPPCDRCKVDYQSKLNNISFEISY